MPHHSGRSTAIGLAVAFVTGVAFALQIFLTGRLRTHLGSAEIAGSVNNLVGLVALLCVSAFWRIPQRALAHMRSNGLRLRWWHPLVGLSGAYFITVSAEAAPEIGVALLFVAVVVGQVVGALGVDRAGMAPVGKRPITVARLVAVALALAAVAIGAVGAHGDPKLGLLVLAVVAGLGVAVQQAGLGHMTRAGGEPIASALVNFLVGTTALVVVTLIVTGGQAPNGWSAPPEDWLGGLIGAAIAATLSKLVSLFGVLPVILGLVAGQTTGGLLIDLVEPSSGHTVGAQTVVSVVLTICAVAVSGLAGARAARARAPA
jgi:transporter family-2 protein